MRNQDVLLSMRELYIRRMLVNKVDVLKMSLGRKSLSKVKALMDMMD